MTVRPTSTLPQHLTRDSINSSLLTVCLEANSAGLGLGLSLLGLCLGLGLDHRSGLGLELNEAKAKACEV